MQFGRVLIGQTGEMWLKNHSARLNNCKSVEGLDEMFRERPELINADAIVLPTGWWTAQHAENWKGTRSRPALIAISDYQRDTPTFISDVAVSLRINDDVVPCNYDKNELLARIIAVRRRTLHNAPMTSIVMTKDGTVAVDLMGQSVHVNGVEITDTFTPMERAALVALARKPGWRQSKEQICEAIMSHDHMERLADCLKLMDVVICKIRKKLAKAGANGMQVIGTFWGQGYAFDIPTPPKGERPRTRRGPRESWSMQKELVNV